MAKPWVAAAFLFAAAPVLAEERPAATLDRMSWDSSCAVINDQFQTALDRNEQIAADTRSTIQQLLDQAAANEGDRTVCLETLKQAYDELALAYGRTAGSANVLGGATTAPEEPAKVDPRTLEGERTGEVIGDAPAASDE
jgi:hypothetical protein